MGIRAWTTETSSACATAVVHVAHECWIALWRLFKSRSDSDSQDALKTYRLDTEIHTSDGRLSLDLDWNTTQADATPLKDIPADLPENASCRPDVSPSQLQSVSIEPDITYIKSSRGSPSLQVAIFKPDVISVEPDAVSTTPIKSSRGTPSPEMATSKLDVASIEPDAAYIKPNRGSPSPQVATFKHDVALIEPKAAYMNSNRGSSSPQVATFKLDVTRNEPNAVSNSPILASVMPDVASENSTDSSVTSELDLTKSDLPVDSKRDSRNLPEVVCFSDIPIPVEGNIIDNHDGGLHRNTSQRVSFLQTGLHFGSAVDIRSTSSISAQSSPGLQSEFQSQPQPVYDNTPQPRPSFQHSPQPRQSFQYSPQPRQSFQSASHPFEHHNRPPSYRSPSPLPVYLQRFDSVSRGNPGS